MKQHYLNWYSRYGLKLSAIGLFSALCLEYFNGHNSVNHLMIAICGIIHLPNEFLTHNTIGIFFNITLIIGSIFLMFI